jgi:peptidyl-tRNA hydrolase, PTH1 family
LPEAIKLIVGLGNPGRDYAETRHNAGSWFIELLAKQQNAKLQSEAKFHALVARTQISTHDCWLLIPTTFMNLSGKSVQAFSQFYKILPSQILVAHDELDFLPGTVRLKQGGGHGGHNGLRDIMERLGADFFRLRIGIGHPGHRDKVHDYVLNRPNKTDYELIQDSIIQASAIMPDVLEGNVQKAMRNLHTV